MGAAPTFRAARGGQRGLSSPFDPHRTSWNSMKAPQSLCRANVFWFDPSLYLAPRLNEQLVDQYRVGVLEMGDESLAVTVQLLLAQSAGTDHLVMQDIQ